MDQDQEVNHDSDNTSNDPGDDLFPEEPCKDVVGETNISTVPKKLSPSQPADDFDSVDDVSKKLVLLSKGHNSYGYKYPLYQRCELREAMQSLTFWGNGIVVERPPSETVFRPGQEVFLCPVARTLAIGKIFIMLGVMPSNLKHIELSHAILLDRKAYELKRSSGIDGDLFRACPLKYVGKVPNGATIEQTQNILLNIVEELQHFFQSLLAQNKDIGSFDFVNESEASKNSRTNTRNAGLKTPVKIEQKCSSVTPQLEARVTPPYAKRILSKLVAVSDSLQSKKQADATVNKVSNQLAKANEKLSQVCAERDFLKKEKARLEGEVSALKAQLAQHQQSKEPKLAEKFYGTEAIGSFPPMPTLPPASFFSAFAPGFQGTNVHPYGYGLAPLHRPPSHSPDRQKIKKHKKRKTEERRNSESESSS